MRAKGADALLPVCLTPLLGTPTPNRLADLPSPPTPTDRLGAKGGGLATYGQGGLPQIGLWPQRGHWPPLLPPASPLVPLPSLTDWMAAYWPHPHLTDWKANLPTLSEGRDAPDWVAGSKFTPHLFSS